MSRRKDPFRTLDDRAPAEPAEPAAAPLPAGPLDFSAAPSVPQWLVLGHLRVPLTRPNWVRRLFAWLLLGWRYDV